MDAPESIYQLWVASREAKMETLSIGKFFILMSTLQQIFSILQMWQCFIDIFLFYSFSRFADVGEIIDRNKGQLKANLTEARYQLYKYSCSSILTFT